MPLTIAQELAELRSRSLLRKLRTLDSPQQPAMEFAGKKMVNFSSNDYLGLATEPALRSLTFRYADGHTHAFDNTNQVLKNFPLCNGMKTGYTEGAGHCLISSASHNGRDIISVVLGDSKQVWVDSYRLLAWGLTM